MKIYAVEISKYSREFTEISGFTEGNWERNGNYVLSTEREIVGYYKTKEMAEEKCEQIERDNPVRLREDNPWKNNPEEDWPEEYWPELGTYVPGSAEVVEIDVEED